MTKKHVFFYRCYDLAYKSQENQSPNPMVGAVIVHKNRIIGEGFHQYFGGPHAEINAIQSVEQPKLLNKTSIYVSLEPCFNFGKTPPCVNAVMNAKFKEVFIGTPDINPETAENSIKQLINNQQIVHSTPQALALDLLKPFKVNILQKRPYIILKYAVSKDGFIGQRNQQVWLSNPFSKRLVHLWRSKADAILVGGQTVRTDNPKLTTRFFGKRHPLRVVLSQKGDIPRNSHLLQDSHPTIIATNNHQLTVDSKNVAVWKLATQNYLLEFMKDLYSQKNIGTIIIEGGAQTIQSFIDANLWDEARVILTPKILHHGIPQPNLKNASLDNTFSLDTDTIRIFSPL